MNIKTLRIPKILTVTIAAIIFGGCTMSMTGSQTTEAVENTPLYKKEVIISTGYANISAQKSKNQAQRNLTEQVYGQNLNSSTTIEDMVVLSDTMRAHVQGVVYGAKVVSISPIGDDSYETKLELEKDTMLELRRIFLVAR